jgi:hypothetical protein
MGAPMRKRYNEVDYADIVDDYTNLGKSCFDISLDYDCSQTAIRCLLMKMGVELRPQGRKPSPVEKTKKRRKCYELGGNEFFSVERIEKGIKSFIDGDYSQLDLAIFWRCSLSFAQKILKIHNVKGHGPGFKTNGYKKKRPPKSSEMFFGHVLKKASNAF